MRTHPVIGLVIADLLQLARWNSGTGWDNSENLWNRQKYHETPTEHAEIAGETIAKQAQKAENTYETGRIACREPIAEHAEKQQIDHSWEQE